jgi:5-formyltetrahydrofolate cyclo-ligase
MTTDADLDQAKAEARRRARVVRAVAANADAGARLVAHFPAGLKAAGVVAGYWPLGSEIDPRPLMTALAAGGAALALPWIEARGAPAIFRRWREGAPLAPDAFGMLAPGAGAEPVTPDLILAPVLAFDRRGGRLGQGGGHYDRILAALKPRGVVAVGLAFAAQEIDTAPMGPLDQRLDWIVTEDEAIACAGAR